MFIATSAPKSQWIKELIPILSQACAILREEYQLYCSGIEFNIEKKTDASPVTQADYRVHQYIASELGKISDFSLLSEEGILDDYQSWQTFWLLDPLDGTKEFLAQRPEFTINLSLIHQGKTVFAILAIPCQELIYIAPEQGLPFKFEIKHKHWYQFVHHQTAVESQIRVGVSQSYQNQPKYIEYLESLSRLYSIELFKAGSAYKFCMMLENQIDIYPRFHPTYEWDTSAGQCLLERIGGGLMTLSAQPFYYNQRDTLLNGSFIAYRTAQFKTIALDGLELMSNRN
ncbi:MULTISPECIES: 3'(2'),5'-bisphosphate nucleotidase CysQ [unclassified Acinetobacter]|uniref:3'(2'),5'-bisphosphate nucleotidase CysQ family protein n=1 Tax=unclassified Acinetobacter TaxID=196816 RepID=UPI0029343632|nr:MULTISPECIES: 3'(2'),5'-bisphosphate nucleotidase CysQ [unclassified Acinetobacter]WOE31903.1 3'(2'),5'-bisphosphate nucleotidase CysQ [Acinetobacter sp. SAAs470]WOE37370.1 3'(2'),5'-bisphosphate nucleotidase CysQ [Acinetobacter sp. SAAs474]